MDVQRKSDADQMVAQGELLLLQLQKRDLEGERDSSAAWKSIFEDAGSRQSGVADAIRAAIRSNHGGVLRTSYGVLVCSKRLVMEVYLDTDENYSVSGYAHRMDASFGKIYLGLDKGREYDAQSTAANHAIGRISRRDAFELALRETQLALEAMGHPPSVDVDAVVVAVLAALCRKWFDLPDGFNVITGGFFTPWRPPRCPGHYAAPSGYIFKPDPNFFLRWAGQQIGQTLNEFVARFVTAQRATGHPPAGVLSGAIFSAFADTPEGNEMVARTIIGVMMGFLPTVEGNLHNVVEAWLDNATFGRLRIAYNASAEKDFFLRADAVIREVLMQGMQAAPVPDAVWRTAVKEHVLGPDNVPVHRGDKVVVDIAAATAEDLASRVSDVTPIFGGDRRLSPHPTHACPGYEAAMGVLLGVTAGLLGTASSEMVPFVTARGAPL